HDKPAVEAQMFFAPDGRSDANNSESLIRFDHAAGNQRRQQCGVAQSGFAGSAVELIPRGFAGDDGAGVLMRGADHHVRGGDAGLLFNQLARGKDRLAWQGQQIADDDRHPHSPLFNHQRLAVNVITHSRRGPRLVITGERGARRWGNDHGTDADAQFSGKSSNSHKQQQADEQDRSFHDYDLTYFIPAARNTFSSRIQSSLCLRSRASERFVPALKASRRNAGARPRAHTMMTRPGPSRRRDRRPDGWERSSA